MTTETRIPAEILSEIFHLLCDEPIALEKLENSSCFDVFPWAVGQVCRRWRTTFLSDPHLWTSLSLHSNPLPDHSAAYLAEMNRRSAIYLKRSGQLPLTIAITPEYSIITIWKMLLSCSNRWRKAEIILSFSTGSVIDGLLECRGRFPIFESLTIYSSGCQDKGCHNVFEIAPHLTELNLELYHRNDGWIGTWIRFPWIQLTKPGLTLSHSAKGFTTGNELRAFLLQLQNVEDLRFTIPNSNSPLADFKFPPVRLTRLRFLKLSVAFPSVIFSWFELPFLEHLWLDCRYFLRNPTEPDACQQEISSFIDRSLCRIRQLTFQSFFGKVARSIMKTLASVEELYVKDLGLYPRIVLDIADFGDYLPKMRVLQVNCCSAYFGGLVDFSLLLKVRSKESTALSTWDTVPLERLTIRVDWGNCSHGCCVEFPGTRFGNTLQAMTSWPSFSVTHVHGYQSNKQSITLNARALAAGTLIDLTFYFPNSYYFFIEEYRKYHSILDSMCAVVI
jgi:hypothetical protein